MLDTPKIKGISSQHTFQTMVSFDRTTFKYKGQNVQISDNIPDSTQLSYISIFENETGSMQPYLNPTTDVADGRSDAKWVDYSLPQQIDLEGKYSNITTNSRIVDENLKICPNNMNEGTWHIDNHTYYWTSNEPIYATIISKEGYIIGEDFQNSGVSGIIKMRDTWCVGTFDGQHQIILDGLLMYPYGPAMLSHYDEGTHDEYGQYYEDKYDDEHPFYHKEGKILGNTGSTTTGMVFVESE